MSKVSAVLTCVALLVGVIVVIATAETFGNRTALFSNPPALLRSILNTPGETGSSIRAGSSGSGAMQLDSQEEVCSQLETTETMKSAAICQDLILHGFGNDSALPAKIKFEGPVGGLQAEGNLIVCSGDPFSGTSAHGADIVMGDIGVTSTDYVAGMGSTGAELFLTPAAGILLGDIASGGPLPSNSGATILSESNILAKSSTGELALGESGTQEFTNDGAMLSAHHATTPNVKTAIIRATNSGVYGTEGTPLASMEVSDEQGVVQGSVRVNGQTNPPGVRMANASAAAVTVQSDGDVVITLGN